MEKMNVLGTEISYYQYNEDDTFYFNSPEFEGIKRLESKTKE